MKDREKQKNETIHTNLETKETTFVIEKIKNRPLNKRKLLRRTLITALMAVMFGLIACFTFLLIEPIISNMLHPQETAEIIIFPEDQEEMLPEEMLSDQDQENDEEVPMDENDILSQIRREITIHRLDMANYIQLDIAINQYVKELSKSLVTINDYYDTYHTNAYTTGILFADNGLELMILADVTPLEGIERFKANLYGDISISTTMKHYDPDTGIAIFSISKSYLTEEQRNELGMISLGFSNINSIKGTTVIALGTINGVKGSLGRGIVTSEGTKMQKIDANYDTFQTDIHYTDGASGFIFNLSGQVIGILTSEMNINEENDYLKAYGTTSIRNRIEKMANGYDIPYIGIIGEEVTKEAHQQLGVPQGIFVQECMIDSPSMQAGIQQGDIIVGFNGDVIVNYFRFTTNLIQEKVGNEIELTIMRQVEQDEQLFYRKLIFTINIEEFGGIEFF